MTWLSKLGDWGDVLSPLFSSPNFEATQKAIKAEKKKHAVYPAGADTFKAFELCQFQDTRVVILGQDPYHNGQATGLAFAVNDKRIPPSLKIITRELQAQYDYVPDEFDYSLEHWAKQGVLLLNTALTVVKGNPASHIHLWSWWTPRILMKLSQSNSNIIFVLWGKQAQSYSKYIQSQNILKSAHPAAEAYSGGKAGFFGNGHFLKINEMLDEKINWFEYPTSLTDDEQIQLYNE
jgi:uracil-DNA glycosylase